MEAVKAVPAPSADAEKPRKKAKAGPKRHRIGGAIAALANKHGIGVQTNKFPPRAMVTDAEYEQAQAAFRKVLKRAKKHRDTEKKPSPFFEEVPKKSKATRRKSFKLTPPGVETQAKALPELPTTYGRDSALLDATRLEYEAWNTLCETLRSREVITDDDLRRTVQDVSTPGTRVLTAIRQWAEAFVTLDRVARERT